ncbi:MAG: sigma-54 dependent transcriptional regulator [Deltaproteobacteria bacterium]|nr:sigma-54 dependent transcriptional regulator [Deltaproteobacteria bacterium]
MNLAVSEGNARKASGTPRSPSRVRPQTPHRRVLIVDDEENLRHMLQLMLRKEGYESVGVADVQSALQSLQSDSFDIVLTDLRMPGRSGMELVDEIRRQRLPCTVVVMTAYGSKDVAIQALKHGAYDYISKPFDSDELILLLRKAEERERLAQENVRLRRQLAQVPAVTGVPGMVGTAPCMADLYRTIQKVAEFRTTVLIQGESGTGKELVARALHALSPRHAAPFVAINCGAIPGTLLESELFGHKRGAFTDASRDHKGMFEEANGGTIFLDEVADMPMPLQVKLLRTLQESHVRRLGDERDVPVDVRVVAASARELSEAVASGQFRSDLFYRLNVITLRVPSLRERREDIPALVAHLLERLNERLGLSIQRVSNAAMAVMMDAPWHGNVRELENALERAMVLAEGDEVTAAGLPAGLATVASGPAADVQLRPALRRAEERVIREALQSTNGNRTQAALRLGVSHRTLLYKIREHGLGADDVPAPEASDDVQENEK